jgi:hypothetical protein
MSLTVSELITEVRDQLDEVNTLNVTDAQILAALNRGQRKGTNIITRKTMPYRLQLLADVLKK